MAANSLTSVGILLQRPKTLRVLKYDAVDTTYFAGGSSNIFLLYPHAFSYLESLHLLFELIKNLLIVFAAVYIIVALLIPQPRIFMITALNIFIHIQQTVTDGNL